MTEVKTAFAREGERSDDLMCGLRILQDPKLFCFGMDAVLLAHFPALRNGDHIMDLCTGNGIVPLLLCGRLRKDDAAAQDITIEGLELNGKSVDLATRSAAMNGLKEELYFAEGDVREVRKRYTAASFSLVTCNPPYMKEGEGLRNPEDPLAIARHELTLHFEDVAQAAAYLLKNTGRFALVHRPRRLPEILEILAKVHLEPKRLRFVHPKAGKEANLVLIEAVKCGRPQCVVEPPLIIYNGDGTYTEELLSIYGMNA